MDLGTISKVFYSMMSQQVIQHMFEEERSQATFKKEHLSSIIYDGPGEAQSFIKRQNFVENDPALRFDPATIHRSRQELMTIYAKKMIRYTEAVAPSEHKYYEKTLYFPEQMPLSLHESMFISTLKNLCDEEQVKMFLEPAEKCSLIGCYAQTELGHGSDVKSLMTTATYDEITDSFIMNTPTTKAAKWWIGDLGVFATHAGVFAQLLIKGKNHGVHCFIVPIRDQDHKPMPNIEVGDVGPKYGFNCKDNGYMIMNSVKIPRKNMLMKFHRVSKEGKYQVIGNEKITYATMLKTRALIPFGIFHNYSKAITILVRYSLARKQFKDTKGKEMSIINYQLQQEKLFPKIADVFAIMFATKNIMAVADTVLQDAKKGKFDRLNEAHVITSSIKAVCTKDGINGMEMLRRAAGGHGYSSYSGIPSLQLEASPSFTFEGDFTILMLQVARYILKCYNRVHRGSNKPLASTVAYLKTEGTFVLDTQDQAILRNPDILIKAFINNSCYRIKKAGEKILSGVTSGMDMKKTWDEHAGIELVEAATAHSYYWMVNNFHEAVKAIPDKDTQTAMQRLVLLYAIDKILEYSTSFFETKSITSSTFKALRKLRYQLLEEIRPDSLTLVEAFEYTDHTLQSAIGHSDGKPYDHLIDCFRNSNDVNKPEAAASLREYSIKLYQHHQSLNKPKL